MKRKIILLSIAAGASVGASLAMGQNFTGSVLYQLSAPIDIYSTSGQPQTAVSNQVVGTGLSGGTAHALLFTPTGGVDLNPILLSNIVGSLAYGTNGSQQVGYGSGTGQFDHALLWTGTAESAVDLNPTNLSGFTSSYAYGTNGAQQVGNGFGNATGPNYHALLWNGTADSAVDLHPTSLSGFGDSIALFTDGAHQVGSGTKGGVNHALLWSSTADSAVDLNPTNLSGIDSSTAYGTSGNQQVGYGTSAGAGDHALLWTSTADSAVDLNPAGITNSYAYGTNAAMEVGQGDGMAMLWTGTADSAVNLQNLLPASGTWSDSAAYSIDEAGNIFGVAHGTFNDVSGTFAVEWIAVPEPMAGSMILCVAMGALMRRRRHRPS